MIGLKKFFLNLGRSVEKTLLPVRMCFRKNSRYKTLSGKDDGVVVCLTSFPERFPTLWIVMDSLFRQTVLPDRIVLVLSEEECPGGFADLPDSLTKFRAYGLEIVFSARNLFCHNKYHHALSSFPNATVITVDDDCHYGKRTLEKLMDLHEKYPGCVCCNIAAIIDKAHFNVYRQWRKSTVECPPGHANLALGFAGILYPPHIEMPGLFDGDMAMGLCPKADDLWLKANEVIYGIKVACGGMTAKPVTIPYSQKVALRKTNKGRSNMNDAQWKALDAHFHLKERMF